LFVSLLQFNDYLHVVTKTMKSMTLHGPTSPVHMRLTPPSTLVDVHMPST